MADNTTLPFDPETCTLETCPIEYAQITYTPSLGGNIAYAVILGLILVAQLGLGIRYKTWGFMVGMVGGLALEVVGYAGRIPLHYNPFKFDPFLQQLICLTIAPAFLSASIYLCLARIVVAYGPETSRLKPRTYTYIFVTCDFISLVLQGGGGGITATANTKATNDMGVNIMIAGMTFQVVSLAAFMAICAEYAFRIRRRRELLDYGFEQTRSTFRFKGFLYALAAATILIFIRCAFRVAELSEGFNGPLANNEVTFMIFEGPMIMLATLALTVFHPGICFAGRWAEAKPMTRKQTKQQQKRALVSDMDSSDYERVTPGGAVEVDTLETSYPMR
ncbi:putative RTA1 domain protein [Microdochium trichocladiopsis]|uniref:RTA1 domain protein n=1 Tax=Microdochium trichocladiopsis TaxID=1682393 RepID=A0A9P8YGK8_9PEZI|nr:putative RTA1 domain protein [Microdochium trichocladiopsis]KAH7039905.1 putative RTA1 domain protein [Microdochium trichocladiopsis]